MAYPGTLQIDYATPYEVGTTPEPYPIGQRAETPDGSIYRYVLMGGTVGIANRMYQGAATAVAHWTTQDIAVAMAVGDTEISFHDGGTAFTVNQLAGGSLLVEETSDLGHEYRVKSNVVTASQETICQLEDGVTVQKEVAIAGSNALTANLSPWRELIVVPTTTPTNLVVGVPRVIIAISGYGWVQSRGVASCYCVGAPLPGNPVIVAGTTAGAVGIAAGQSTNVTGYLGRCLQLGITGDYTTIFITLE